MDGVTRPPGESPHLEKHFEAETLVRMLKKFTLISTMASATDPILERDHVAARRAWSTRTARSSPERRRRIQRWTGSGRRAGDIHLSGEPKPRGARSRDRPETMPEQHVTISRHTVETVGMAVGRSLPPGVDAQHAIRFRCSKLVPRETGCLHWRSEKDGSDVMRRSARSGTLETRNRIPCSDVVPVRDRLEKACANSFLRAW
jgi:hypothetical protein